LATGEITSKRCFHTFAPIPTPRIAKGEESNFGDITLIPHGFKIAIEFRNCVYIGEIRHREMDDVPEYRFTRQASGEINELSSRWEIRPGSAFNAVCITGSSSERRPNGKMYIAVFYSEPQQFLRAALATYPMERVPQDAREIFQSWLSFRSFVADDAASPMVPPNAMSVPVSFPPPLGHPSSIGPKRRSADDQNGDLLHEQGSDGLMNIAKHARLEAMRRTSRENSDPRLAMFQQTPPRTRTPTPASSGGGEDDTSAITRAMRHLMGGDSCSSIFQSDTSLVNISRDDLSHDMTAGDLFHALKHPRSETLSRREIKRAMRLLLQLPIPSDLVDATFKACDVDGTGRVTLENFVHAMEARENDLFAQFTRIDLDGSGEITLEELRRAKDSGAFDAQERELTALLGAMDRANEGAHAQDRKIQWAEFRALMILLPPATTIQTIVDLVRQNLDEQDQLQAFDAVSCEEDMALEFGTMDAEVHTWPHVPEPMTQDHEQFPLPPQLAPLPFTASQTLPSHGHAEQPLPSVLLLHNAFAAGPPQLRYNAQDHYPFLVGLPPPHSVYGRVN
jgi:Ca2+-binding EF-hand superfamily protein